MAVGQFNKLKLQADEFIQENINHPLICKRREIDWLIINNKRHLLETIATNNGIYTLNTLKKIVSYDFVLDYVDEIIKRNQSQLFSFAKIDSGNVYVIFSKHGYQPNITFKMSFEDFVEDIAANCIVDSNFNYSFGNFYSKLTIQNTRSNLDSIMNYISNYVHNFNCALLFDDDTNNIILYRRGDGAIKIFHPSNFLNSYSKYLNKPDDAIKRYIFNVIKDANKWISKEIQSKQGVDEKMAKLYKEQYLDIKEQFSYYDRNKQVEITTYKVVENSNGNVVIDFNNPEYVKISRRQIRLSDNTVKNIDYAIYLPNDILEPLYPKETMLFIQDTKTVKNNNTIFYVDSEYGLSIKRCFVRNEHDNITKQIPVKKENLLSYGKIVYSFIPKLR